MNEIVERAEVRVRGVAAMLARLRQRYLRDLIYGGIDGVVTTFAIIAGAQGAQLSHLVVIILGVANLVADGVSMAASNFLGTRAEIELAAEQRRVVLARIDAEPERESEAVRDRFRARGFKGVALESVVDTLTAERERWADTLTGSSRGSGTSRDAWPAAVATFVAFVVAGAVPLMPYLAIPLSGSRGSEVAADAIASFEWSLVLTAATFFSIGAAKAWVVKVPWWRAGLETLAVGGLAAGIAYGLGDVLRSIV